MYQLYIKATAQQIWDAITKNEIRRLYFHGGMVESTFEAGTSLKTMSPDGTQVWGDNLIMESDPPRKLVHGWKSMYNPEFAAEQESRVTWEIEPQEGGYCKFTLTHDRLEGAPLTAANVAGGWMLILCGMKTVIETGESLTPSLAGRAA